MDVAESLAMSDAQRCSASAAAEAAVRIADTAAAAAAAVVAASAAVSAAESDPAELDAGIPILPLMSTDPDPDPAAAAAVVAVAVEADKRMGRRRSSSLAFLPPITEASAGDPTAGTSDIPRERRTLLPPAEPGPAIDEGPLFIGRAASTAARAASGERIPVRLSDRSSDPGSDPTIPMVLRKSAAAAAADDVDPPPAVPGETAPVKPLSNAAATAGILLAVLPAEPDPATAASTRANAYGDQHPPCPTPTDSLAELRGRTLAGRAERGIGGIVPSARVRHRGGDHGC